MRETEFHGYLADDGCVTKFGAFKQLREKVNTRILGVPFKKIE